MDNQKQTDVRKNITFSVISLVALLLALLGYFYTFFNKNTDYNTAVNASIFILAVASGLVTTKEKSGNKLLQSLITVDTVLFVSWVITIIVGLFI
ncbi:hypothetical protein [Enterococcus sp. JM9B]|jgi:zinc transporter ZupT|uniref:hypothetical protein n=1 Tax=Enterococcus sp. JM9B TaxID=1857216 RepID=UPI001374E3D8|nr:hypothetical protein [Enterococcus sp. JM9B]KAF1302587.1 hypothetical protein BAU16_06500 [Enterococcus sp. JM9B]